MPAKLRSAQVILAKPGAYALALKSSEPTFAMAGVTPQSGGSPARARVILPTNAWSHVAVTYDSRNLRFYVNGRQVSSTTASALNRGSSLFWIGKNQWGQVFDGAIDEVVVYDKVLSADDLAAMFEESMVAY